jgi:proteasome lid subunit RPN8/RPN11
MILDSDVITKISFHLKRLCGRELCGYLALDRQGRQEFYPLTNRSDELDRFWISKGDYRRLVLHLARGNFRIVAFIHSHPSSLELSLEDSICLRHSDMPWIIVRIFAGELQSRVYEPTDAVRRLSLESARFPAPY